MKAQIGLTLGINWKVLGVFLGYNWGRIKDCFGAKKWCIWVFLEGWIKANLGSFRGKRRAHLRVFHLDLLVKEVHALLLIRLIINLLKSSHFPFSWQSNFLMNILKYSNVLSQNIEDFKTHMKWEEAKVKKTLCIFFY